MGVLKEYNMKCKKTFSLFIISMAALLQKLTAVMLTI